MTKKLFFILTIIVTVCAWNANAQTNTVLDTDRSAIKQTALDYIEGWYEVNAERMERSLHLTWRSPSFAKTNKGKAVSTK